MLRSLHQSLPGNSSDIAEDEADDSFDLHNQTIATCEEFGDWILDFPEAGVDCHHSK